ncbi:MAG: Sir2 family NAD-dependent protein deacetylase, partial [Terriglobales bacterium]
ELATPEAFKRNPGLVWRWYDFRREAVKNVQPNPGHRALVALEKKVPHLSIVTQNVDGLHATAGSESIIELHGNIGRVKCFDRDHYAENVPAGLEEPPKCHCGSLLRPDVVWFGESLPQTQMHDAFRLAEECDVMLVVGTSGLVQPAASLPYMAKRAGAKVVEINPDDTSITDISDIYLRGASGEILPRVVNALDALKARN